MLGNANDSRSVVAFVGSRSEGLRVFFLRELRGAGHDPDEAVVGIPDRGAAVVRSEVDDEERGFERPEKLHSPVGIRCLIDYGGDGFHLAARGVEGFFVEDVADVYFSIRPERVNVHGANIVLFHEPGDGADDIPVTHEALEVDVGNCGRWRLARSRRAGGEKDRDKKCAEFKR